MNPRKDNMGVSQVEEGKEEACGDSFGRPCGLDGDGWTLPHVDSVDAGLELPCNLLLDLCCGTGVIQGQW